MADQNYKLRFDFIANNTKFNSAIGVSSNKLKSFGNQMTKTGRMLSTRLSLPLAAVGGLAVKQAANFERLQTTLNTLTGSAEEGAAAFEKLVQFSAKTPFQLDELVKVNNTLMGFGLNANEAFDSLSMLGDISGIVGGDLQSIGIAFGQAAAEGRVMTRDLRQFINNGVPILDILAESMGVARGEIMDMASEGKITFDILNQAFRDATSEGGKFEGGMETLSQTLNGLFSTLKDNVNIALAELGQEIAETLNLKEGIPALSNSIGQLVTDFQNLDVGTRKLIIGLTGFTVVAGPLLLFFGSLAAAATAITTAVSATTATIIALSTALGGLAIFSSSKGVSGQMGIFEGSSLDPIKLSETNKELQLLQNNIDAIGKKGFIGPLGKNQNRLPFSLVQPPGTFSTPKTETQTATSLNIDYAKSFDNIVKAGTGINTIVRPILEDTSGLITRNINNFSLFADSTKKKFSDLRTNVLIPFKETIKETSDFSLQFAQHIGQTLMSAFANLGQGEDAFKRLGEQLKALIIRLAVAAGLAMVISAALGKPTNMGKIFSALSGFGSIPMAKGGIVSGPTTALIGEYPGARSNPEVVAPLSKLKSMIDGGATQGEFVLRGQDLVVALQRAERNRNRFK